MGNGVSISETSPSCTHLEFGDATAGISDPELYKEPMACNQPIAFHTTPSKGRAESDVPRKDGQTAHDRRSQQADTRPENSSSRASASDFVILRTDKRHPINKRTSDEHQRHRTALPRSRSSSAARQRPEHTRAQSLGKEDIHRREGFQNRDPQTSGPHSREPQKDCHPGPRRDDLPRRPLQRETFHRDCRWQESAKPEGLQRGPFQREGPRRDEPHKEAPRREDRSFKRSSPPRLGSSKRSSPPPAGRGLWPESAEEALARRNRASFPDKRQVFGERWPPTDRVHRRQSEPSLTARQSDPHENGQRPRQLIEDKPSWKSASYSSGRGRGRGRGRALGWQGPGGALYTRDADARGLQPHASRGQQVPGRGLYPRGAYARGLQPHAARGRGHRPFEMREYSPPRHRASLERERELRRNASSGGGRGRGREMNGNGSRVLFPHNRNLSWHRKDHLPQPNEREDSSRDPWQPMPEVHQHEPPDPPEPPVPYEGYNLVNDVDRASEGQPGDDSPGQPTAPEGFFVPSTEGDTMEVERYLAALKTAGDEESSGTDLSQEGTADVLSRDQEGADQRQSPASPQEMPLERATIDDLPTLHIPLFLGHDTQEEPGLQATDMASTQSDFRLPSPPKLSVQSESPSTDKHMDESLKAKHLAASTDPSSKSWYYLDPTDETHGPCSVTQMHTWMAYLAGTPELQAAYHQLRDTWVWKVGMPRRVPITALLAMHSLLGPSSNS